MTTVVTEIPQPTGYPLKTVYATTTEIGEGSPHAVSFKDDEETDWERDELDDLEAGAQFFMAPLMVGASHSGRTLLRFVRPIARDILRRLVDSGLQLDANELRAEPPFAPSFGGNGSEDPAAFWYYCSVPSGRVARVIAKFTAGASLSGTIIRESDLLIADTLREAVGSCKWHIQRAEALLALQNPEDPESVSSDVMECLHELRLEQMRVTELLLLDLQALQLNASRTGYGTAKAAMQARLSVVLPECERLTLEFRALRTLADLGSALATAQAAWRGDSTSEAPRSLANQLILLQRKFPVLSVLSAGAEGELRVRVNSVEFTWDGTSWRATGDLATLMSTTTSSANQLARPGSRLSRSI